jgi:hypothetical protein
MFQQTVERHPVKLFVSAKLTAKASESKTGIKAAKFE